MTRYRSLLMVLLCIAILVVRVGGAHLHLCLDGQEAPASVHLADDGLHHDAADATDAGHHDVDLDLGNEDLLAKLTKIDLPGIALLVVVFLLLSAFHRTRADFPDPLLCGAGRRVHLRPPLRGPPCLSFV